MYMLVASGRGHQCLLCVIIVHRPCCASWSRWVVRFVRGGGPPIAVVRHCPWSWPWWCVVVVFASCSSLVPRGCGPLSSMKDNKSVSSFVRVRSGEERALHTLGSACATRKRPSLLSTTPAAAVRFHLVLDTVESDPASLNRRHRCPISVLLSHQRSLVTSSRVIIDPSSCCVTPMTMWQPIGRLVASRYGRRGTWVVCVITGMGERR